MFILNFKVSTLLVVFYSLSALFHCCQAANNLALGRPYVLSSKPNYPLTAPPTDTRALTDGKYSVGHFWTQKSTLGWQRTKSIEILIDLEKESNVGSIAFNTVRGEKEGEVSYPAHITAFVGNDREHFLYIGDLAIDSENRPGPYHVKQFVLNNIGKRARYVFLEIIPKGQYLFCDEIEVIEGSSGDATKGTFSVAQALIFSDNIRRTGVGEILSKQAGVLNEATIGEGETKKLQEIKLQTLSLGIGNGFEVAETKMFELRSTALKTRFPNKKLLIQPVKPWDHLIPTIFPAKTELLDLSLLIPKGGYDFKSLSVTNLSEKSRTFSVFLGNAPTGVELAVYQVPFVKTAAMEYIADPLAPAEKSFTLRPGESRIVFVAVRGTKTGTWHHTLQIKSEDEVSSIPITAQVVNLELPKRFSLNTVNWGYLDFKLIHDRQQTAVADLLAHYTNVVVVSPAYMPNADPIKPLDFTKLESYLKLHKGADKVFLFMKLSPDNRLMLGGGYPFLGEQWKTAVKRWYEGARQAAVKSGFKADQVYWYPFDEMQDKEIDQFIALARWARNEIPGVRLYATLGRMDSERALPYLDIAQIVNIDVVLKKFLVGKAEKWLYDAKCPAKSLSPYSYYRLMAWKAFLGGYKGIGFWAYADAGWGDNPGTAWDDFDGKNPDYAVIYEGEGNTIISSRRWEAWRMGIEDYELLTMYSKAKGNAVAKALAKSVLDNPLDTTKADEVRRKILLELSK